jgi:WD40 repeat protein
MESSYGGVHLAAAEFESVVHIWDLRSLTKLNSFETKLDFGGTRLAISPDGKMIAVGAWAGHSIAVYRVRDGFELWRRKDLTKVQRLDFDREGRQLLCSFEQGASRRVEAKSGETAGTTRGAKKMWESPLGSAQLLERRSQDFVLANGESPVASIPKVTFAALSVAFSPSEICLSEAGGPVRLCNLSSGTQLWRHDPPKGVHFLDVAFSAAARRFVGVSWPFERGGTRVLSHFDEKGVARSVCKLGSSASVHLSVFCAQGTKLVTNTGDILDTESGQIKAKLW